MHIEYVQLKESSEERSIYTQDWDQDWDQGDRTSLILKPDILFAWVLIISNQ